MSILDPPLLDDLRPEDRVLRGQQAMELLESQVMADAWAEVERALLRKSLSAASLREREDARRSVLLIAAVREYLTEYINLGIFEEIKAGQN